MFYFDKAFKFLILIKSSLKYQEYLWYNIELEYYSLPIPSIIVFCSGRFEIARC